jgi:hypothetical protein
VGATTDGHGTDRDQQSTGQRCGRSPTTRGDARKAILTSGNPKALRVRALVFNRSNSMKYVYMNNTNADTTVAHAAIMAAIANGGVFNEDFADIFVLTKTPEGSDAEYVLNFA